MTPFICHNCKAETMKLIGTKDGIFCPSCYNLERPRSANLHIYDNKWAPRMSKLKEEVIKHRVKSKEGQWIDSRTGRPTER